MTDTNLPNCVPQSVYEPDMDHPDMEEVQERADFEREMTPEPEENKDLNWFQDQVKISRLEARVERLTDENRQLEEQILNYKLAFNEAVK